MKFKKFKSVDANEKRIALATGHVFRIGLQWVSIPEFAWKDCYAAGCISEDFIQTGSKPMDAEDVPNVATGIELLRREAIDLIKSWIKENKTEFFKADNTINTNKLRKALGSREIDNKFASDCHFEAMKELDAAGEL